MSHQKTILQGNVVLPNRVLENGMVIFEEGIIHYVGPPLDEYKGKEKVVLPGYIWPGLIDLHVHGAGGKDVMDGTKESLEIISQTLVRFGVTGFLATTLTMDKRSLEKVFFTIAEAVPRLRHGAQVLGIHLEGPWICSRYRGAQNPQYIVDPIQGDAEWGVEKTKGLLRLVTLAPELPGALDLIRSLVQKNVIVSIGHTGATYDEALAGVLAGASQVTHCFNAMTGLHHRDPGVAGIAMVDDRLKVELIADGFHVHPVVVQLLVKVKDVEKLILISDGMRAVGMPEGDYELGGLKVTARGGKVTLPDGRLAGSLLTLDQAVRNVIQFAEIPLWQAVRMASLTPAQSLGIDDKLGSIEPGKQADLVVTDQNLQVRTVWVKGRLVYDSTLHN
mgnify:CR=1 FL=1